MKVKDVVPPIPNNKDTLYPTWFRWKDVFVLKKQMFWSFISHMVQMKVSRLDYDWCKNKTLYPTWFRWKKVLIDL